MTEKNIKDILILSHSTGMPGAIDYFEDYLIRKGFLMKKLEHPLDNYNEKETILRENKNVVYKRKRKNLTLPLNLLFDLIISVKEMFKLRPQAIIAANNFDTFCAVWGSKFFRKDLKIIYFASDFSENRFKNKILNRIYLLIEKFAVKKADITISNTKRAEEKRKSLGLDIHKSKVIPNGVYLKDKIFRQKIIKKNHFVFVGCVSKEHGLFDLINILHPLINKLVIIGFGNDWERTVALCKEKNINIELHYKKSHEFVINYLKDFEGFGLAPYNLKSNWTYYCSPLKVNEYLACGVPVIMSDVPEIAALIRDRQYGIVYKDYNLVYLKEEIFSFDMNDFYKRAEEFYKEFNRDFLFQKIDL